MSRVDETIDPDEAGCRVYLLGPHRFDPHALARDLDAALGGGGIAGFLLRTDGTDRAALVRAAEVVRAVCREREVAWFVEDDADLGREIGADGVHLTSTVDVADARARLGAQRIVGAACALGRHAAMEAGEAGADYVSFGDEDRPVDQELLETIAWWSELFVLPCLALGRITPSVCPDLASAGADFIGVGEAVWQHPDGAAAGVAAFREALRRD